MTLPVPPLVACVCSHPDWQQLTLSSPVARSYRQLRPGRATTSATCCWRLPIAYQYHHLILNPSALLRSPFSVQKARVA
ncbi:hypothetical protein IF2G_01629 [Cordyceps javanica]|nr:hypothetical protein IF2G_01629 [Cordyceps javanica]